MNNEEFWVCPDCSQENFAASRFCELCGKLRGSQRPGPGPATVSKFRGERTSRPASEPRRRPVDDEAPSKRKNKVSMLDFSERIRALFRRPPESPRQRGRRRESFNPVLTLVLAFVIWGLIRVVGSPFLLLLKFIAFLFTPFGLPVWLALAYVYGRNRALIHGQINAMRERVQMFASVAARAAGSLSALRGGVLSMFGRAPAPAPDRDERPGGKPVRGASVRILDEEWDDDYDDYDDDEGRR